MRLQSGEGDLARCFLGEAPMFVRGEGSLRLILLLTYNTVADFILAQTP